MSSVILPLRGQAAAEAGAARPGSPLLFPLRLLPGGTSVQQRELEVLKAVAAAVAVSHTAESLTLAREAQKTGDDLGARFKAIVAADLRLVLDEVVRVQGNRAGAPGPDEEQRVVAAAIGADPVLVAAAHAKVKGADNTAAAARAWVACIDAALLEKAAHAGARREHLNPGSKPPAADVEDLRKRLEAVEAQLGVTPVAGSKALPAAVASSGKKGRTGKSARSGARKRKAGRARRTAAGTV